MTDEITTADSGADQIPVDNTNISVTDFANRRLGQMKAQQNVETESEPVAEETTEETPEEVVEEVEQTEETQEATETQEAEEGEPEVGDEEMGIDDEIEPEADEEMHAEEEEADEEMHDESKVIEIDGVKYAPVVSEEEEESDEEMKVEGEDEEDEGYGQNEDLDLESILRELEEETVNEEEEDDKEVDEAYDEGNVGDGMDSDEVKTADEAELAENDVSSDIGAADNKVKPEAGDSSKVGQGPESEGSDKPAGKEDDNLEVVDDLTEDLDLEEVLKALTEGDDEDDEEKKEESVEEINTLKADIEEHRNVVKYLRGKLNEVNLLNAKLLFTNKLFRNFGLNNEQKLKVVETFDRATNLREVKLVFSTLAESFGNKVASKPSKPIKESKGSASKAVASTKPKSEEVISEGFEMKERFQKLAKIL